MKFDEGLFQGRAVRGSGYNICDETYHKVLVNAEDNEGYGRHLPGSAS